MAQLTDADYAEIRDDFFRMGFGKEEMKALAGGLPTQAALLAGLQTFEDTLVSAFAGMKTDFDTAISRTTTNAGCQKILAAYLRWKVKQLLGV
jgi:hypothetical protein